MKASVQTAPARSRPETTSRGKSLPHKWYVVANGQGAIVFQQEKDTLELVADITPSEEPSTKSQKNQGHSPGGNGSVHFTSSPKDQENSHDEDMFLADVIHWLEESDAKGRFDELVIAASPKALGQLRQRLPQTLSQKITKQIDKDYTNMPIPDLEKALLKSDRQ